MLSDYINGHDELPAPRIVWLCAWLPFWCPGDATLDMLRPRLILPLEHLAAQEETVIRDQAPHAPCATVHAISDTFPRVVLRCFAGSNCFSLWRPSSPSARSLRRNPPWPRSTLLGSRLSQSHEWSKRTHTMKKLASHQGAQLAPIGNED